MLIPTTQLLVLICGQNVKLENGMRLEQHQVETTCFFIKFVKIPVSTNYDVHSFGHSTHIFHENCSFILGGQNFMENKIKFSEKYPENSQKFDRKKSNFSELSKKVSWNLIFSCQTFVNFQDIFREILFYFSWNSDIPG